MSKHHYFKEERIVTSQANFATMKNHPCPVCTTNHDYNIGAGRVVECPCSAKLVMSEKGLKRVY